MSEDAPLMVPPSLEDFFVTMTSMQLAEHEARHVGEGDIAVIRRRTMQVLAESRTGLLARFDARDLLGELGEWLDAAQAYRLEVCSEAGYANEAYQRLLTVFRAVERRPRRSSKRKRSP